MKLYGVYTMNVKFPAYIRYMVSLIRCIVVICKFSFGDNDILIFRL